MRLHAKPEHGLLQKLPLSASLSPSLGRWGQFHNCSLGGGLSRNTGRDAIPVWVVPWPYCIVSRKTPSGWAHKVTKQKNKKWLNVRHRSWNSYPPKTFFYHSIRLICYVKTLSPWSVVLVHSQSSTKNTDCVKSLALTPPLDVACERYFALLILQISSGLANERKILCRLCHCLRHRLISNLCQLQYQCPNISYGRTNWGQG